MEQDRIVKTGINILCLLLILTLHLAKNHNKLKTHLKIRQCKNDLKCPSPIIMRLISYHDIISDNEMSV